MILIVDDHASTRHALVRLITLAGYQCIGVSSGPEALQFLLTSKPDLIILDGMMPGMDGLDVLRAIKQEQRTADIPVLFYSADSTPSRISQAMASGAREFIVKGSTWGVLLSQVEKYGAVAGQAAGHPAVAPASAEGPFA